jgi:hypothetical protein
MSLLNMPSKLFLIGIMGSAVAMAVLFVLGSPFTEQTATAQMMQGPQQMPQHNSSSIMNYSMFNIMGMSMVENVGITGVSITGNNQVSVNLVYTGNGTSSPSVAVVAMTNHMAMMMSNMMMGGSSMGTTSGNVMTMNPGIMGMESSSMPARGMLGSNGAMMTGGTMNGTQSSMMAMMTSQSQSGSTVVNGGWQSGSTINVLLAGNGSVYDTSDICVMVFPHLA